MITPTIDECRSHLKNLSPHVQERRTALCLSAAIGHTDVSQAKLKIAVEALRFIADKARCESYKVPGMGSGLDYEWVGCDPHQSEDPEEWCITCTAKQALARIRE